MALPTDSLSETKLAGKRAAAAGALELVQPGMRLGLGTGSTAHEFVALLGERVAGGLDVVCVPTSERTAAQAAGLGIRVTTLDELPELDLTIDGADEFDPQLNLIKGGGGALLREKIVATASRRMVVITDSSKQVAHLGRFPLPIEVNRFGLAATRNAVVRTAESCGCRGEIVLRQAAEGGDYLTDGGHLIFDCHFGRIDDPAALAERIVAIAGVVEHGLFVGIARGVICAGPDGVEVFGQVGEA